jgi:two-component system, NarL family, sensor kinase
VKVRSPSVARTAVTFVVLGVLALAVVGAAGLVTINRIAHDRAVGDAKQLTEVAANIVDRRLQDGLLTGDAEATLAVAGVVYDAVLFDPVDGVTIRQGDGTVVYADDPDRIGEVDPLSAAETAVLHGAPPLTREDGSSMEVARGMTTPGGVPLLFQTSIRLGWVDGVEGEVREAFAPRLVFALIVLAVLAGLLAWGLAVRVLRAARERESLLQRAVDAQDRERRRIAGDLHDGPVQELAGLSMSLAARAEAAEDEASAQAFRDAAASVRGSVRTLRSAIVGVYPPNLQQAGLVAAITDLSSRLTNEGVEVTLDLDAHGGFGAEVDQLLYRACLEGLRNVEAHAGATRVAIHLDGQPGRAELVVSDDGVGIDDEASARARGEGHVGLTILDDLVRDAGGELRVERPGAGGTVLRVEVPVP